MQHPTEQTTERPTDPAPAATIEAFARRILESGRLADKLAPPPAPLFATLDAGTWPHAPGIETPARGPAREPAREPGLELGEGAASLPRPAALTDRRARALCLARFAHHELMAVELFAWALLRWSGLPPGLRADWLGVLADEQRHCRLYLDRLSAHGSQLADHAPHSAYFWRQAPAIAASEHGPRAFLSAMGLTLEQANLDFTLVYRDAFRRAGDAESADVCQRVHDDEIEHVRCAARWLMELDEDSAERSADLTAAYERSVPFPLSAARAKGRRFDHGARRRAGLDATFVEHVRRARPPQALASGRSDDTR